MDNTLKDKIERIDSELKKLTLERKQLIDLQAKLSSLNFNYNDFSEKYYREDLKFDNITYYFHVKNVISPGYNSNDLTCTGEYICKSSGEQFDSVTLYTGVFPIVPEKFTEITEQEYNSQLNDMHKVLTDKIKAW